MANHPIRKLSIRHKSRSAEVSEAYTGLAKDPGKPQWEKEIYTFLACWYDEKDHIVAETSGSTGTPKTIYLKKEWMEFSAKTTCNYFGLHSHSKALLCIPAAFIGGMMMIVRAIAGGFDLHICQPSANPFRDLTQPVDFAAITPFQLHQSRDTLRKSGIVETIIVGGGEIDPQLESNIQDLPVKVYATYGMTETSSHVALREVNGQDRKDHFTVVGNTTINTDDRNCLTLENPALFEGKLTTNDLVEILDEQRFRWKGRHDNIINTGGIKVVPEKVERAIAHLINENYLVCGQSDSKLGQAVTLVIESTPHEAEKEEISYRNKIAAALSPYELPRRVIFIEKIPVTRNGKPDRRAMKELLSGLAGPSITL